MTRNIIAQLFAAGVMLMALAACGGLPVNHEFSFGGRGDNEGIEVLNYKYGDKNTLQASPPDWALSWAQRKMIYGDMGA